MFSREASDRLAFYASVGVHVLLLATLLKHEASVRIYLPALPMSRAGSDHAAVILQDWLRKQSVDREDDPRWNRFGEPDGKGYAINTSPGEDLLYGREGEQDQAWLSRDPVGPGPMPEEPSPSTALPGDGGTGGPKGSGGQPGRREIPSPQEPQPATATPFGVPTDPAPSESAPRIAIRQPPTIVAVIPPAPRPEPIGIGPATTQPAELATPATQPSKPLVVVAVPKPIPPTPPPPPGNTAASPQSPPTPAQPPVAATGNGGAGGGRPGPPIPPADPAPMSDSESDPFARVGSATVRAGKVDARLGRAHKLIKPRLTVKALIDLQSMANPSVTLKVSLDATGKVTNVEVLRSSGSNEVDLPTTLALYKSWIEPRKDKTGQPIPDVIVIVFNWR